MIMSKKLTAERIAEIEKMLSFMMMTVLNSQRKNYKNLYHIIENTLILCLKIISFKVDADILAMMKATGEEYQARMNKYLREAVLEGRF